MFKKLIMIPFLLLFVSQVSIGQEEPCSKPKVNVKLTECQDDFIDHLNKQYSFKPKEEWLEQIQAKVLTELKKNSPGTQFIPGCGDECDYYFAYILNLLASREGKVIDGIVYSYYTGYQIISKLAENNPCGLRPMVLEVYSTHDDRGIFQIIESNIALFGDIGNRIKEQESSHPVPPRGPKMEVSQDKEYVSPLEEERDLDIRINVTNCRGETVYDKYHGQVVTLPRETERSEIKPTHLFPQECWATENLVLLIIVRPVGASATYTLRKGMKAGLESVNIVTCGRDKRVVEETEIQIRGLEIVVNPEKEQVCPDEKVKININFNRVDIEGVRTPVTGKIIQLDFDGIVDGEITPSDYVLTDENGSATLTYVAGDKDGFVNIKAKYQPKNYNGYVQDIATIDASCDWEWSGTMTVEKLERFDCELDQSKAGHYQRSTGIHNLSTTRATVSIKAENIDDSPPGFNIEMGENLTVSGFMKCELRNYEERNNRKFINPRTSHHVETLTGEDTYSLNDDNLDLTFMANIEDIQKDGSLDELVEMLETGEIDAAKLEAFGAKYEESMGLGESGQSKITVLLTLFGDCMCKAILRQSGWGEENGKRTTTNESETIDMWIGGGFALEFSADYSRNKDGSATITGNYSNSTPITDGIKEGCPPKTEVLTCNLTLSKRPKK